MRTARGRWPALRRGHAMASDTKAIARQIRIVVSKDRLQAWVELPALVSPCFSPPGEDEIITALTGKGIELTEAVRERVRQYLQIVGRASPADATQGCPEVPERFLIAEGYPPVEATDGRFEWDEAFSKQAQAGQNDAPVDYYTLNSILTIEAGTTVGRIVAPTDGQVGRDVFGKELTPRRRTGLPVKLGHGLRAAAADPQRVVTDVPGWLAHEGNTIRMSEVLRLPGDVDFKSGNVNSVVDVHIRGGVKPNFSVKTTKSLTIQRAVEAAELDVGGDLQVRGGLFGHYSRRLIKAGGSITASICDAAHLEADGDICITKEIINCTVRAAGELQIEHGSIVGGEVFARNGVKLKHAGSELGVPTRIAVGIDGTVLYRARKMAERIRKQQRDARQLRAQVKLLLAHVKRLTAAQRVVASEWLAKAAEIERITDDLAADRKQMLEQATPDRNPVVDVAGTLYPGVVVVFGLREAAIKTPVKGPIRLEERKVRGVTEIVTVNEVTASVTPLPSVAVDTRRLEKAVKESAGPGEIE